MEYRTDIEYIAAFNPRQSPVTMNYVAALNGYAPVNIATTFRYCDLGCGPGLTLLTLAAAFPHGEFLGVDFNENHIRMAKSRAEAARLTNVKFVLAGFSKLPEFELPAFDFMTTSGTLSWLTPPERDALLDVMGQQLRQGGLAYLHYMVMPGHAHQPPLCRLASDYYKQLGGDAEEKVLLTKEFLKGFVNSQKRYFEQSPPAKDFLQMMINSSTELFLHDYLSNVRAAYYFEEMADMMRQRGLDYAGSTEYFWNHLQLVVPMESRDLFRGVRDRTGIEAIKDFLHVSGGRTDIFIKTDIKTDKPPQSDVDPLEALTFGIPPHNDAHKAVNFPGMTVQLDAEPIATVLKLLQQQPLTLAELYRREELGDRSRHDIRKALTYAVAIRKAIPLVVQNSSPVSNSVSGNLSAYNRMILAQAIEHTPDLVPSVTLAAGVIGNGHTITWIDAVMLYHLLEYPPQESPQRALELLQRRRMGIKAAKADGSEASPAEAVTIAMVNASQQFAPMIKFLGIANVPTLQIARQG